MVESKVRADTLLNALGLADAGEVDFYHEDFEPLYSKFSKMAKSRFVYGVSDHYPLWMQLDVGRGWSTIVLDRLVQTGA